MPTYGSALNEDANGRPTSAIFGIPTQLLGSGWYLPVAVSGGLGASAIPSGGIADGGIVALGFKADAAVTDPTTAATLVALTKGVLTAARLSPAGILKAEDAVHASGDSGVMTLAVRNDLLGVLAGTTGDYSPTAVGPAGELFAVATSSGAVSATAPTNATSTAYVASGVVKASPGVLFGLAGFNSKATAQFVQLHDTTSVPSDTAVPKVIITVPGLSNFSLDFGLYGRNFATGITICNSSTGPTKTVGSADIWYDVQYR